MPLKDITGAVFGPNSERLRDHREYVPCGKPLSNSATCVWNEGGGRELVCVCVVSVCVLMRSCVCDGAANLAAEKWNCFSYETDDRTLDFASAIDRACE